MATTTLRPSGTTQAPAAPWSATPTNTAAGVDTALNDNLDTSYVAHDATTSAATQRVDFGTFTVPALAQVRTVQLRYRVQFPNFVAGDNRSYRITLIDASGQRTADDIFANIIASTAIMPFNGAIQSADAAGLAWDQADINALAILVQFWGGNTGSTVFRLVELYADVITNEAPVATVTAPAEGATNVSTTRPTITWTYTDPENDAQERYQVKVFSAAQYNDALFNVETSTPTWDSGVVYSQATSVAMPVDLQNATTYRAYVRVADVGSGGRYSAWDNNTFTISLAPAAVPTITATAENANGRVRVDITTQDATGTHAILEYSDDGGSTWKIHRAGNVVAVAQPSRLGIFYDTEAVSTRQRWYRARATNSAANLTSAPSDMVTVTPLWTSWWLKDPLAPQLDRAIQIEGGEIPVTYPEEVAEFLPLGRARKVILKGDIRGAEMSVVFFAATATLKNDLVNLRNRQTTLLLQSPVGESWYVRITSWAITRHAWSTNAWRAAATLVEVDAPGEQLLASDIFTLDVSLLG